MASKILFDYLEFSLGVCISPILFFELLYAKQCEGNSTEIKPSQLRAYVELISKYILSIKISLIFYFSLC